MNTVNAAVLRACLKAFLGEQDYRKFLEAGAAEPMKFWQERAWEKFTTEYPEMAVLSDERASAFDVCPVHESPLNGGFTDSPKGHTFINAPAMQRDFPRALSMPLVPVGINRVTYCQKCVAAKAEYFATRNTQKGART